MFGGLSSEQPATFQQVGEALAKQGLQRVSVFMHVVSEGLLVDAGRDGRDGLWLLAADHHLL
jgi:hypothetical protein